MNTVQVLFKKIDGAPHRDGLESDILLAIGDAKRAQYKWRLMVSYAGLFCSGLAIILAGWTYAGAFFGSEFLSVVGLLFSDITTITRYWNEFFLLLLETIPVIPIALVLLPTFVFLLFLGMYAKTTQKYHFSH